MDNAIATVLHTHETAVPAEHPHVPLPQHRHHFETEGQQREAAGFGMWLFLLTEIMFFGGMFGGYTVYRNWYPEAFAAASRTLPDRLSARPRRPPRPTSPSVNKG